MTKSQYCLLGFYFCLLGFYFCLCPKSVYLEKLRYDVAQ